MTFRLFDRNGLSGSRFLAAAMARKPMVVAVLVFALAALAFTGSGFLPGRVLLPLDHLSDTGAWKSDPTVRLPVSNRLLSDAILQFHPWDEAMRRALRDSQFPWRNPYAGRGAPLFANPQVALFSPLTWPRLLFGVRGWAFAVFLKLLLTGLGVFWLTREMGGSPRAALVSGLVALASGFSIVWGLHPNTNVFAFLPYLAAASLRLTRRVSRRNVLAVLSSAALATAGGHPETLAFGVVGIGAFLLWELLANRSGKAKGFPLRATVWCAAAAGAGFFLLAVQLVPFFLLLARSRILELRSQYGRGSFRGVAALAQVLPGFLGSPLANEIDLTAAASHGENFNTRSAGFIGFLTLLLLLLAARRLASIFRRGLLVGAVALGFALRLPPVELLLRAIPLLSLGDRRYWTVAFVLFASTAAGPAFMLVVESDRSHGRTAKASLAAGAVLVLAGLLPLLPPARGLLASRARAGIEKLRARGSLRLLPEIYEARLSRYIETGQFTALRRLALPGACWVLAGFSLLGDAQRRRILPLALAGELLSFGVGYLPSVPLDRIPREPPVVQDVKRLDPSRTWMVAATEGIYPPNLATLDQIRDIRSYDLLEDSGWAAQLRSCGYDETTRSFPSDLSPRAAAKLARMGVRYVFSREPLTSSRRVGGGSPPAAGLYELAGAEPKPMPGNTPPDGFAAGATISAVALVFSVGFLVVARLRKLEALSGTRRP